MRAVAVVLVLGRHCAPLPGLPRNLLEEIALIWHRCGYIGVDLFFVLSGFLVAGLLFKEHKQFGTLSLKQFFGGFKIYPPLWCMLGCTVLLYSVTGNWAMWSPGALASELLFLQNYGSCLWGHDWSLAVEEHFYLALPLLLILLSRRRPGKNPFSLIPCISVSFGVMCLLMRLAGSRLHNGAYICYSATHMRIDSLFFGVMLSYLYHYAFNEQHRTMHSKLRLPLALAGLLLLTPAMFYELDVTRFLYTYGFTLFYIGAGLLLVSILDLEVPDWKTTRALRTIGSHSYSIYLWQGIVVLYVSDPVRTYLSALNPWLSWYLGNVTLLACAIAGGIVVAKLVELPVLRLRDRVAPSRLKTTHLIQ
jgi:peptidoglycan/LPS O-acetylase OafA/YrhL